MGVPTPPPYHEKDDHRVRAIRQRGVLRTGFKTLWIGELPAGLASLIGAAGKSTLTAR